tara:strand:- start:6610 stop:7236 length:627 start_codon:yes stop_codon:yes gene_type:complete
MKKFDILAERLLGDIKPTSNSAVFTFGRMNPPTQGHQLVINKVIETGRVHSADHFIFVSRTVNKDNPLEYENKLNFINEMAPHANVMNVDMANNPFNAAYWLRDKGYKEVIMIAGSDRVDQYQSAFAKYLQHEDPEKSFNFESFEVVSAGTRDPDAKDVKGFSSTTAKQMAVEGDWSGFKRIAPTALSGESRMSLYTQVRRGLGAESS